MLLVWNSNFISMFRFAVEHCIYSNCYEPWCFHKHKNDLMSSWEMLRVFHLSRLWFVQVSLMILSSLLYYLFPTEKQFVWYQSRFPVCLKVYIFYWFSAVSSMYLLYLNRTKWIKLYFQSRQIDVISSVCHAVCHYAGYLGVEEPIYASRN